MIVLTPDLFFCLNGGVLFTTFLPDGKLRWAYGGVSLAYWITSMFKRKWVCLLPRSCLMESEDEVYGGASLLNNSNFKGINVVKALL